MSLKKARGLADAAGDVGGTDEEDGSAEAREDDLIPNPDGFASGGERLPKGYAVATAHAEAVLLDRVRAQLEKHYDQVFIDEWLQKEHARQMTGRGSAEEDGPCTPPRRRGAHRVDKKVLEAHFASRYTVLALPEEVKAIYRKPADESDWAKAEKLRAIVMDAAQGIYTITVDLLSDLDLIRAHVGSSDIAVLRES